MTSSTAPAREPAWISAAHGKPLSALSQRDSTLPSGHYFPARSSPPKATLIALHGIQTHSAWFSLMAREFNARDIAVIAPNRRGSGSMPERATMAADIEHRRQWLDDLDPVVSAARGLGAPVFLVGTSWGAKLALGYAGEYPDRIDGVALLVPALKTRQETLGRKIGVLVGAFFSIFNPKLDTELPLRDQLYLPERAEATPVDAELLAGMRDDPGLLRRVTFRFLWQQNKLQHEALKKWRNPEVRRLPLQAVFAARDQVVDEKRARKALPRADSLDAPAPIADAGHGVQVHNAAASAAQIGAWILSGAGSAPKAALLGADER